MVLSFSLSHSLSLEMCDAPDPAPDAAAATRDSNQPQRAAAGTSDTSRPLASTHIESDDLEHLLRSLKVKRLRHQGDNQRLGNRLLPADG